MTELVGCRPTRITCTEMDPSAAYTVRISACYARVDVYREVATGRHDLQPGGDVVISKIAGPLALDAGDLALRCLPCEADIRFKRDLVPNLANQDIRRAGPAVGDATYSVSVAKWQPEGRW